MTVSGITPEIGAASHFMKSTRRPDKTLSAEQIARIAERGKDVSYFFTNTGDDGAVSRRESHFGHKNDK